jgi:hypothetical protein
MANGTPNPLAAPLTSLKQIGSQAVQSINSLNTGLSTTLNQGLDALIAGTPPIPGLPGGQAVGGGLPTPASLLPTNLKQALSSVENMLIPPGLTKPSSLLKTTTPTPTPTPTAPQPTATPTPTQAVATTGRRRITEIGGF